MNITDWKNKKAVIVLHEATTGPGHDLRDYLLKHNIKELLVIAHPLLYIKDSNSKNSRFELYKNGRLVIESSTGHYNLPEYVLYLKDLLYTIFWVFKILPRHDVFIGLGNLNAFTGILLKCIRLTRQNIYYVIDYVPQRFSIPFMDSLYHYIEKISARYSDATWNLSPRMIEAREEKWNRVFPHQYVVPHGVHASRIKKIPFREIRQHEIIYMGTLLKKQGIQLVLEALPVVIKKYPDVTLTIIGKGPYEAELKLLVGKYSLKKCVNFLGYVDSHKEMENRIARSGIAVALYDRKYDTFTFYSDPGKIKNYLGAGVPVILTDVPFVAKQVAAEQCGIVIEYDTTSLVKALNAFFSSSVKLRVYRQNARKFARKYDWETVFTTAFRNSKIT